MAIATVTRLSSEDVDLSGGFRPALLGIGQRFASGTLRLDRDDADREAARDKSTLCDYQAH